MKSTKLNSCPLHLHSPNPPRSRVWIFSLIAALLPAQNLSAARLSVLYSGGGSQKTYARVFVTSTAYDGNLGGLAGADAKCQARADAASLGGTWKAIISTSTVNARDRMKFRRLPVYDLLGRVVWNPAEPVVISGETWSNAGSPPFVNLGNFNYLGQPVSTNENKTNSVVYVWTGTQQNGTVYPGQTCSDWTTTSGTGAYGYSAVQSIGWIYQSIPSCSGTYNLYCLEDE